MKLRKTLREKPGEELGSGKLSVYVWWVGESGWNYQRLKTGLKMQIDE